MILSQLHSMPTYICKGIEFNVHKVPKMSQYPFWWSFSILNIMLFMTLAWMHVHACVIKQDLPEVQRDFWVLIPWLSWSNSNFRADTVPAGIKGSAHTYWYGWTHVLVYLPMPLDWGVSVPESVVSTSRTLCFWGRSWYICLKMLQRHESKPDSQSGEWL